MALSFKPRITVFHCINAFTEKQSLSSEQADVKTIRMPCSGMTTEVYLLKAFEAGADAVAVLVCPQGVCRYTEGSLRAEKRIGKTRSVLDEIGVNGQRLTLHQTRASDKDSIESILNGILEDLKTLGPNPAA